MLGPSPPEARGILATATFLQEPHVLVLTGAWMTGRGEGERGGRSSGQHKEEGPRGWGLT